MGKLYLPGAILFVVLLLHSADGSASQRGFTSWFDSALNRQTRDAEDVNAGEAEVSDECSRALQCQDSQDGGYGEIFGEMRFGEIYSSSIGWCSQRSSCWDDTCTDMYLKSNIQMKERIVDWICDRREEFLLATPCFTHPFPALMGRCFVPDENAPTDIQTRLTAMRNCINSGFDSLPLCTANSKHLFWHLFDFVAEMQVIRHGV